MIGVKGNVYFLIAVLFATGSVFSGVIYWHQVEDEENYNISTNYHQASIHYLEIVERELQWFRLGGAQNQAPFSNSDTYHSLHTIRDSIENLLKVQASFSHSIFENPVTRVAKTHKVFTGLFDRIPGSVAENTNKKNSAITRFGQRVEQLRRLHLIRDRDLNTITDHKHTPGISYGFIIMGLIGIFAAGITFTLLRQIDNTLAARDEAAGSLKTLNEELENRVDERTRDLRHAQRELISKERLATLGQLAATISHELRNPLGTIRTSMFTITDRIRGKGLDLDRPLERIERNIIRCDNIISELLDYARDRKPNKEPTLIDNWLAETLAELVTQDSITVKQDLVSGANVEFDRDAFRQVVVNLVQNAEQAMNGNGPEACSPERCLTVSSRTNGSRIEVTFGDTGPGIPREDQAKIFEPLFSTKVYGVGLGLPLVKKILEQHGGGIEISSIEGQGAQAALWLPLSPDSENKATT